MRLNRIEVAGYAALLALAAAGCDVGPTEPRYDPVQTAVLFAEIPNTLAATVTAGEAGEFTHEAHCPAGGSMTFEGSIVYEEDDAVYVRRASFTRRYVDCGLARGTSVVVANGELTYTGETHLEHGNASWPAGVVRQTGHQVGTLTLTNGDEVTTCEYDLETVSEPAAGRYAFKGVACGVPIDIERDFSGWRSYWRTLN